MENFVQINTNYGISNKGNVKSLKTGKILKPSISGRYARVTLEGKKYYIHRLVGEFFIPKIEGKIFINHKDGNRYNNDVSNLEWCTQKENVTHSILSGRRNRPAAKLNKDQVKEIRTKYSKRTESYRIIGERYGVCGMTISQILRNETWTFSF